MAELEAAERLNRTTSPEPARPVMYGEKIWELSPATDVEKLGDVAREEGVHQFYIGDLEASSSDASTKEIVFDAERADEGSDNYSGDGGNVMDNKDNGQDGPEKGSEEGPISDLEEHVQKDSAGDSLRGRAKSRAVSTRARQTRNVPTPRTC